MPKVKYIEKNGSGVSVMRWRFLPDGRVLDPKGKLKSIVPAEVAYSAAAKRMARTGILDIEGYAPPVAKKESPKPEPKKAKKKKETP